MKDDDRPATLRQLKQTIVAVAVAFALFVGAVVFAVVSINAERAKRIQTVSQVIGLDCNTNNDQDRLLARLIQASIASSGTSFGENVDPATLTTFDRAVLTTIAKVAASGDDADLTDKFARVLAKLRDLAPCQAIVQSYLDGDPIAPQPSPASAVGHAVGRGIRAHPVEDGN